MRNSFYMKTFLALLVLVSLSCKSQQADSKMDKLATPIIETFFTKIATGEYDNALTNLLGGNPNITLNDSSVTDLRSKFELIHTSVGAFKSNSLIKKRTLNNSLSAYSYLAKYEKKFYRFLFIFYNNDSKTLIYKFSFDDNLDVELEESLKQYAF